MALVALELMPSAVAVLPPVTTALAFGAGAVAFIVFDFVAAWYPGRNGAEIEKDGALPGTPVRPAAPLSLFAGVLGDMLIDGMVIGIGATAGLATGLRLALGLGLAQLPLAFVSTTAARRQGLSRRYRRVLLLLYFLSNVLGALFGYLVLRNQPEAVVLTVIAGAGGFLFAAVTQVMIPQALEALRDEAPSLTGLMFVVGLAFFAAREAPAG